MRVSVRVRARPRGNGVEKNRYNASPGVCHPAVWRFWV